MKDADALQLLRDSGWLVQDSSQDVLSFSVTLRRRYGSLPRPVSSFLGSISLCVSPTETAWFLTQADYSGASDAAFVWNEFELISKEAAGDDRELLDQIERFWGQHFPFLLSVKAGYSYCALDLSGQMPVPPVVVGFEPEFESPSVVAPSFSGFLERLALHVSGDQTDGLIDSFI